MEIKYGVTCKDRKSVIIVIAEIIELDAIY